MKENILILGGDKRMLYCYNRFLQYGYNAQVCGFSSISNSNIKNENNIEKTIKNSDIIILPFPVTINNVTLNAPYNDEIINLSEIYPLIKEKNAYGGILNKEFIQKCPYIKDYSLYEELVIKNAQLTCEGILDILISQSPYGILNTNILILGYGRIGKIIASYIKAIGGKVSVCARKERDFAWIEVNGISYIKYNNLCNNVNKYKFIINTVPYMVMDKNVIDNISKDCLVVDVASKNGGCDFQALSDNNIKYFHARGIPGKYSPKTAGEIISDVIIAREKD